MKKPRKTPAVTVSGDAILMDNIKRALDARDLKPADLARRLGISAQAVSQWFQLRTTPGRRRVVKIAAELGVSPEVLRHPQTLQEEPSTAPPPVVRRETTRIKIRPMVQNDQDHSDAEWLIPSIEFRGLVTDNPDLVALRITGSNLEPNLHAGEWVVADLNWRNVSVSGIYLVGDSRFPTACLCEPVIGSGRSSVRIREPQATVEVAASTLSILGRIVCKLLTPL